MSRPSVVLIPAVLFGCIKPQSTTDDTGGPSSSGPTIVDIQTGVYGEGDIVTLQGVVITSEMNLSGEGFFIQDEGGGEYSGLYVYAEYVSDDLFPVVGDKIDITGSVTEYYDFTELSIGAASDITVVGEAAVVADVVGGVSDWEPWESCLVTLEDQTVTSAINSYGEAGLSEGISMDDALYDFSTESGASYSSVSGLIYYSYEQFKLLPRNEADLVGYVPGEEVVATVASIQQNGKKGTVTVQDVVVTGVGDEGFWVQDEGGGEYSGIYIFSEYLDNDIINQK